MSGELALLSGRPCDPPVDRAAINRRERGSAGVVSPAGSPVDRRRGIMRVIALDVHRSFAEVAVLENGRVCSGGRVVLEHDRVVAFGRPLRADDEVVLEATGNTLVIARLLAPFVRR